MQEATTVKATTVSKPVGVQMKFNAVFVLLALSFIVGMTYGVLLVSGDTELLETLHGFIGRYAVAQRGQSLLESFLDAFQATFFFVFAAYLLGFSAIGQPAAILVPLFKGLGLGAFLGSLYRNYGLQGLGYSVLIMVPYTLVAMLAVLIACRESVRLSNLFFSCFLPDFKRGKIRGEESHRQFVPISGSVMKLYNIKFLVLCVLVVISSVIYTICVLLFSRFFQF